MGNLKCTCLCKCYLTITLNNGVENAHSDSLYEIRTEVRIQHNSNRDAKCIGFHSSQAN
uniref:Uncharacterized protein n=1 Tax=Parascaris equorum TaxID=6256 RepID=A0A914SGN0_PAREQ